MTDTRTDASYMAPFKADLPLILEPFPNGGWAAYQNPGDTGVKPVQLGAYTNAADLLSAMSDALLIAREGGQS